jgi:hypothetical protein
VQPFPNRPRLDRAASFSWLQIKQLETNPRKPLKPRKT